MTAARVRRVRIIGPHADRRTLPAIVLPSWVPSTSKVSRTPGLRPSGSMPADCSALTCNNVSGPPKSSWMKPKPRSAFHIFKVPVAIALYFPLRHSPNSIRRPTNSEDRFAAARKIGCGCATRPAGLRQPRPTNAHRRRHGAAAKRPSRPRPSPRRMRALPTGFPSARPTEATS